MFSNVFSSATETTKRQNQAIPEANRTITGEGSRTCEIMSQQRTARVSVNNIYLFDCQIRVGINEMFHCFRRAKLILRKKKYQENLLSTTDKEVEALEKLTNDLEFAQVQQQVIDGLKVGNEALKKIHEILTIDEVERIMDETREGIEKQQEIDAIISTGALSQDDEDSVAAELEELVASTLPAIDEDIDDKLPEVPTEEPEVEKEKKKKAKERKPEAEGRVALEA